MKNKGIAVVVVAVLALAMAILPFLGACSKPAPAPPAPPPAPTATPKPTATTTPTPTAKPVEKQTFYVGSSSMSSSAYPPTVALCNVVNAAVPELNLAPRECTGGTTENLNLLKTGELKIGFCPWEFANQVYAGTGFYKDQFHLSNLRSLFCFSVSGTTFFVRKDSGVTDANQLGAKPFGSGFAGSTSQFRAVMLIEQGVGVKPNWFIDQDAVTLDAVKSGKIIGTTYSGFPAAAVLTINATVPVIILGFSQEQLSKADKLCPGLYNPVTFPAGTYPGQDKPILTPCSNGAWVVDASFSADLVYKMAKAIAANPQPFVDSATAATRFSVHKLTWDEAILKFATIPLHAGLVRYFKEKGVTVPDKLIPPEAR